MSASSVPSSKLKAVPFQLSIDSLTPWQVLKMCGSLKITVCMFFLAIWLVLFGTLAQDEQNLEVVKAEYFNSIVAIVPFDVLLPITIFPHEKPLPGAFPFPGGATIGFILMLNLIAAKLTRFSVAAKGLRLAGGVLLSLFGAGLVVAIIIVGNYSDGLQGAPPISYQTLWQWLKGGVCVLTAAAIFVSFVKSDLPGLARIALWSIASLMLALSVFLVASGDRVRLDDPGLRIVWQLLQSSVAAMVVLAGLWIVFGNRGGNVLIHIGVALMMLGQFIFGDRQVEQRMSLIEGQQTNLVFRQGELELALIDTSEADSDKVYAIPQSRLKRAAYGKKEIDTPELPCKVKVLEWMPNSSVVRNEGATGINLATAGIGLSTRAVPERTQGGAMSKQDIASAYVELIDKKNDQSLGVFLVSQFFNDQKQLFMGVPADQNDSVTIDGKPYSLGLRFRREYKPYVVYLEDVSRKDYEATNRARDFSSHIVIKDEERNTEVKGHIWMNNPVRYRNESFYQSEYNAMNQGGQMVEMTGLQVVANQGWIIPYVACMLVLFGMLSHFGGVFLRFASRYERGAIPTAELIEGRRAENRRLQFIVCAVVGVVASSIPMYAAREPKSKTNEVNWYLVGQIPFMHEGRVKPLDTVARNVLQVIGEPLFGATPQPKDSNGVRRSGTEWMVALMAEKEWPADSPIFRVYTQEARDYFELDPRPGYLYSYNQLHPKMESLIERLQSKEKLSPEDEKLVHIYNKVQLYDLIAVSYKLPPIPDIDSVRSEEDIQRFKRQIDNLSLLEQKIERANPPAAIPPIEKSADEAEGQTDPAETKWQAFSPATYHNYIQGLKRMREEPSPALKKFAEFLDSVRENDAVKTNTLAGEYIDLVKSQANVKEEVSAVSTEAWLNRFSPTNLGVSLYVLAIIVSFSGMLAMSPTTRWATFTLLLITFVIHTIAIVSRIYISGRPPVVNLYSSAVFIGWAAVLFSLVLELIYPLGLCNLAAALIGASTLSIARSLDSSDTMHVLEAVLDTQFWLSTHVVTVTLGYGATFLAGLFGIIAMVLRIRSGIDRLPVEQRPLQAVHLQNILSRIIYGILCFALLLSFIGTVLGGLWADDSWGRFWGWDPKENGALMIVLWNALVLHANWDRQVGQRGLAVLAILGNIVTSWSWFGTNQLGIGLHSYGFTSAVLVTLALVVLGHLAFVFTSLALTRPKPVHS